MSSSQPNPTLCTICSLIFAAGSIHVIEPNLAGLYGYTEDNTLGRLIGWIAGMGSMSLLLLHLNMLKHRSSKALLLDVTVYGLAILGLGFGLIGAVFSFSPSFFHSVHIRDWEMRLLEGFYAVGGGVLFIIYTLQRSKVLHFLLDDGNDAGQP